MTTPLRSAFAATPVVPETHLLPAKVSSQSSPGPHLPSEAWRSQRPVFGLQMVPLVHIAKHPPAARFAADAPIAAPVVRAAPISVFGLPVLQETRRTATKARRARPGNLDIADPSLTEPHR